jgi:hypothetical protein
MVHELEKPESHSRFVSKAPPVYIQEFGRQAFFLDWFFWESVFLTSDDLSHQSHHKRIAIMSLASRAWFQLCDVNPQRKPWVSRGRRALRAVFLSPVGGEALL